VSSSGGGDTLCHIVSHERRFRSLCTRLEAKVPVIHADIGIAL